MVRVKPTNGASLTASSRTSQATFAAMSSMREAAASRSLRARIVQDIIREVRLGVADYAEPLDSPVGQMVVRSVEWSVRGVADVIGNPDADRSEWEEWFRNVGRLEYLSGRTTDTFQTAARIATRTGWRHIQAVGRTIGIPPGTLFAVADALFQYADEISAVAVAGYNQARDETRGNLAQQRRQLLQMIIADPPIAADAIAAHAAECDWPLPERLAVVLVERVDEAGQLRASELGGAILADLHSGEPCLVVPGPIEPGRLDRALSGQTAALGPVVPFRDAARSLGCASRGLALVKRGVLPRGRLIRCAEHLPTLAMHADEFVLEQLVQHALGPFAELTGRQRERLIETVREWLAAQGGITEVAERLDVHPQTVRYRMNQVHELLGDRLDDPDERLMLDLALRANLPE